MRKLRRQRGDTIVEVLICIAIVSLILAGAYVTTNQNSVGVRDSQEHSEALKLVESQLEQVRTNAAGDASIFTATTPFCMVSEVPVSASFPPDSAKCVQNSSGNPTTSEPSYHLSITSAKSGNNDAGMTFTITAQWDSVTGDGHAQESMAYRLYPS